LTPESSSDSEHCVAAYLGLAQLNFARRNYAEAVKDYKRALRANPALPARARVGLGYCLYELKKYELAELVFQRVIQLDPTVPEAYLGLAVLSDSRGDPEGYFHFL
jgi:RNA polymerase-associated protein CTR9